MVPPEIALQSRYLEPPARGDDAPPAHLSGVFQQIYASLRPSSLLVAPLATARLVALVDPGVTRRVVGIDSDMEKVALARQRYRQMGSILELYCADALGARLQPAADFDLVFLSPPLDRLEAAPLAVAVAGWIARGGTCAVVSRLAGDGEAAPLRLAGRPDLADLLSARELRRAGSWETRSQGSGRMRVSLWRAAAGPK